MKGNWIEIVCCLCLLFHIIETTALSAEFTPPSERQVVSSSFTVSANQKKVKIAFFDADSTLRVAPSGTPAANSATDVAILPLLDKAIAKLEKKGYLIAIVSNQAGIEDGYVSFEDADNALKLTISLLSKLGAHIHYYDFAESRDYNRKPDIGMAKRLTDLIKKDFGKSVDWKNSIMVGDSGWKLGETEPDGTNGEDISNTDRIFAENAAKAYGSLKFIHPRDFFGWIKYGIKNFSNYKSLLSFIEQHPEFNPFPVK